MRDNKYDKLLNLSIVILIVSAVMLGITGYNNFFKKTESKGAILPPSDQHSERAAVQQAYSNTIENIDNNLLAGIIKADKESERKLGEMITLRTEIDSLLKQHASEADLAVAKIKIQELQQKVGELQNRYTNADAENRRLQVLLNQLIAAYKIPGSTAVSETVKAVPEKSTTAGPAGVTGMHLFAVAENNSKKETGDADEAGKIVGSFYLKNLPAKAAGEVMIVVLQPDGKVVKNSVWESGTFVTVEGNKIYSRKILFEKSAEEKQLNFSLTPDKFLKGDYIMQIWYNGNMVGKMTKTLS